MRKDVDHLYSLGFALHWLRPNSKAPLKSNWTNNKRESKEELLATYCKGYGLGVKMGEASKLPCGNYLANIDVDVKSGLKHHRDEALKFLDSKFPGLIKKAPVVKTGYGLRLFVKTPTPVQSGKLSSSPDNVRVKMPNAPINNAQKKSLNEKELAAGWRMRCAWEVEFMSIGRQVVLPPTVHPDTGKPYTWARSIDSYEQIPLIDITDLTSISGKRGRKSGVSVIYNFTPVDVDILVSPLSDKIVEMIISGEDVEDRSAACQSVCNAMVKCGYSDDEILSVLTDRDNYLGDTGYDHRNTESRAVAAAWVRDYCLAPAKEYVTAAGVFKDVPITENTMLSEEDAQAQFDEIVSEGEDSPWQLRLQRSGKDGDGPPKPSYWNVKLVLSNIEEDLFIKDSFSGREYYGKVAPWVGAEKGKAITDADYINIKDWIVKNFGFEPHVNTIHEVVTSMVEENTYHSVMEEFEKLPEWDGVERLDGWLKKNFGADADPEYLAQIFRKWLVAAVTRIYEPGAKFDWLPIFEGHQGAGKSSFGKILFGEKYFTDRLSNLGEKESAAELLGVRCVEFAELASLRKHEMETVKGFITRQVDKFRPAYGRKMIEIPRQIVFFGTTNNSEYLRDTTGNRRFMPVKVGRLNFKALMRDRDQLWAEALFIYKHGLEFSLDVESDVSDVVAKLHREKMVYGETDLMSEALFKFFEEETLKPANEQFPFHRFRLSQLFEFGGPLHKWEVNGMTLQQASAAMRKVDSLNAVPMIKSWLASGYRYWKIDISNWSPGERKTEVETSV